MHLQHQHALISDRHRGKGLNRLFIIAATSFLLNGRLTLRDTQRDGESGADLVAVLHRLDRCRNFPIDTAQKEAEHPASFPVSGVYFLLGV